MLQSLPAVMCVSALKVGPVEGEGEIGNVLRKER